MCAGGQRKRRAAARQRRQAAVAREEEEDVEAEFNPENPYQVSHTTTNTHSSPGLFTASEAVRLDLKATWEGFLWGEFLTAVWAAADAGVMAEGPGLSLQIWVYAWLCLPTWEAVQSFPFSIEAVWIIPLHPPSSVQPLCPAEHTQTPIHTHPHALRPHPICWAPFPSRPPLLSPSSSFYTLLTTTEGGKQHAASWRRKYLTTKTHIWQYPLLLPHPACQKSIFNWFEMSPCLR